MRRESIYVVTVARPRIIAGVNNHAGAHRIKLDIAIAGEHVTLRLDEAGTETPFPKRSRAPVSLVEILRVQLSHMLHQCRAALRAFGSQEQVHVIGHQAIRVQLASKAAEATRQVEQIKVAVFVVDEAWPPVVAALDDVYGHAGEHDAGASWHVRSTRDRLRR